MSFLKVYLNSFIRLSTYILIVNPFSKLNINYYSTTSFEYEKNIICSCNKINVINL